MATLSLTPEYTYITAKLSDISSVSYPRVFYWYCDGDLFDQDYIGQGDTTSSLTARASGLDEGTRYTIECIVENDNTGATVATFTKSATTKEHTPTNPVVMGSCSINKDTIASGEDITVSWTYSGDASSSSYFDIYASQDKDFSHASIITSVSPPTSSNTSPWSPTGSWYFWVVYRGNSSRTSVSSKLTVLTNAWVQSAPYVFTNGQWKPATPYVFTNGQWKPATVYVYKE